MFRITIEADTFDIGKRSTTRSFECAKIPSFYYHVHSVLSNHLLASYCESVLDFPDMGTFSEGELNMLDRQYSMMLIAVLSLSTMIGQTPEALEPYTQLAIRPSSS